MSDQCFPVTKSFNKYMYLCAEYVCCSLHHRRPRHSPICCGTTQLAVGISAVENNQCYNFQRSTLDPSTSARTRLLYITGIPAMITMIRLQRLHIQDIIYCTDTNRSHIIWTTKFCILPTSSLYQKTITTL